MGTNFTRPTIADLIDRAKGDIEGALAGVTARLRRTVEYGLARAIAGMGHGLHGHLAWVAEQILPDQASETFLIRYGGIFGVSRIPAVQATGTITVTGTGGDLPTTAQWVRLADGALYESTETAEITGVASEVVGVRAVVAGEDGNLVAGQELVLTSPISGITSAATVLTDIDGGADIETLDAFLARLLDRIQRPPMGGAPGDHVTWAMEVAGTTRAWEYAGVNGVGNPGLGKVVVMFVRDGDGSIGDPEGIIPDAGAIAAMQAYLDDRSPAEVIVMAPTPVAFAVELSALAPNTGDVQDAIEAELYDMLLRDAEPGATIYASRVEDAINSATGETSHTTVEPVVNVEHDFGELPVFSPVTFP